LLIVVRPTMPEARSRLEYVPQSLTIGIKKRCVNLEGSMALKMLGFVHKGSISKGPNFVKTARCNLLNFVVLAQFTYHIETLTFGSTG